MMSVFTSGFTITVDGNEGTVVFAIGLLGMIVIVVLFLELDGGSGATGGGLIDGEGGGETGRTGDGGV